VPLSWLAFLASASAATPAFDTPGAVMPDRHWDEQHVDIAVRIDPRARSVQGTVTHIVAPLGRPSGRLRLNQVDLDIQAVTVDGKPVKGWRTGPETLDIPMPVGGATHEVAVTYRAHPETGMHFRGPPADPTVEAWSQGEEEDNRYWLPTWDYPNDAFGYSAEITAPSDLIALSNGTLAGRDAAGEGWTTWRYRFDGPLPSYLVAVAVGQFAVYADTAGKVPLSYVVPSGVSEARARAALGQTPAMIAWLGQRLDTPYPWPLYRQVLVHKFLYGAMENTTLTVVADRFLTPTDDEYGDDTEIVVAHELTHQWFGDLVTCYGWREEWLNEAFAAFYARQWQRHTRGDAYFAAMVYRWHEHAFDDTRPLSPRFWSSDTDAAGAYAMYTRGSLVLYGLRGWLGADAFDQGVAGYLHAHARHFVDSDDLRRALEEASGTHLGWYFDTFVHSTAFPAWTTSWSWADGKLTVSMAQDDGAPPAQVPVTVEVGGQGTPTRHTVWTGPGTTRVEIALDAPPQWVAIDPEGRLVAHWTTQQDPDAWVAQLRFSPQSYARLVAMDHLGDGGGGAPAVKALADVLGDQDLPGRFRAHAAETLGKIAVPSAVSVLRADLADASPRVRAACAKALGDVPPDSDLARTLEERFRTDPRAPVRAAAMEGLAGQSVDRALWVARRRVLHPEDLQGPYELEAAARVLGDHGEQADLQRLLPLTGDVFPALARTTAMDALVKLLDRVPEGPRRDKAKAKVARRFESLLHDEDLRLRQHAIAQLAKVGDDASAATLRALASETTLPRLADAARAAADAISAPPPAPGQPPATSDVQKLQERLDALQKRLERLETWRF